MRLPAIQYGQVHSLGREDVGTPLQMAQSTAQMMGSIVKLGETVAGNYLDTQIELETQDAAMTAAHQSIAWHGDNDHREYYSGDELDSDVPVQRWEYKVDRQQGIKTKKIKQDIPGYMVRPHLYKKFMTANIEAAASKITNANAKAKFIAQNSAVMMQTFGKMAESSVLQQKEYMFKTQSEQIETSLTAKNYEMARQVVDNMNVDNLTRKELHTQIDQQQEKDTYDEIIMDGKSAFDAVDIQDSLVEIDIALGMLTDEENYTGHLNTGDRKILVGQLAGARSTLFGRQSGQNAENLTYAKGKARRAVKALNSGKYFDFATSQDLASTVSELSIYAQTDAGAKLIYEELISAINTADKNKIMALMNPIDSGYLIAEFDRTRPNTPESQIESNQLHTLRNDQIEQLQQNSLEYATQVGIVERTPIQFQDHKKMPDALAKRARDVGVIHGKFGTTTAFLYDEELNTIADAIDNYGVQERLSFIASVQSGLGEQAHFIWDQLREKKVGGSFAVAGNLMAGGNPVGARMVVIGAKARQESPDMMKPTEAKIKNYLIEKYGNAYSGMGGMYDSMLTAGVDVYTTLSLTDGEAKAEFNEKMAESAYEIVTGGLLEYEGSTIVRPRPDISQQKFDRYINDMAPEVLSLMGKAKKYSNSQLLKGIQDGDLKMVSFSENQYALYNPKQNTFVRDEGTDDLFTFRYVDDYKTIGDVKDEKNLTFYTSGKYAEELDRLRKTGKQREARSLAQKAIRYIGPRMEKNARLRQRSSELYVDDKGRVKGRYIENPIWP